MFLFCLILPSQHGVCNLITMYWSTLKNNYVLVYTEKRLLPTCILTRINKRFKKKKSFPWNIDISNYKNKLPWINATLAGDIKFKNKLYHRAKRYPSQLNQLKYKDHK